MSKKGVILFTNCTVVPGSTLVCMQMEINYPGLYETTVFTL